jgi:hypothetical protein
MKMKKIFALLILLVFVSGVKGQDTAKVMSSIELVCMNTILRGVDNPVKIVVSGCNHSDLTVTIDNGTIEGDGGEYIVRPLMLGKATITIIVDGKEIQKANCVVKERFCYKAILNGESNYNNIDGGKISKDNLLGCNGIKIIAANCDFNYNCDFNLKYKVLQFTLSLNDGDSVRSEVSYCEYFTEEQIKLINEARNSNKIYIEDIHVILYNRDGDYTYSVAPLNLIIF